MAFDINSPRCGESDEDRHMSEMIGLKGQTWPPTGIVSAVEVGPALS